MRDRSYITSFQSDKFYCITVTKDLRLFSCEEIFTESEENVTNDESMENHNY